MRAESKSAEYETKIISGEEEVSRLRSEFLSRSSKRPGGFANGVNDKLSTITSATGPLYETATTLHKQNPSFALRHLTDVQLENTSAVKKLLAGGYEVRHLEGNKIRFSVSQTEYIETIHVRKPGERADQVLWSDDPQLVAQASRIFDALWDQAVPARWRLIDLEEGPRPTVTTLMWEPEQIRQRLLEMASKAKSEIRVLLPTTMAFHREEEIKVVDFLEAAAMRGVKVTIVSPTDLDIVERIRRSNEASEKLGEGRIDLVSIPEAKAKETVFILVADHLESMVVEQKSEDAKEFEKAVGLAIYSTSEPIVRANIRFIERLLEVIAMKTREEALLQKETFHRRQAELLQDILTHDIRNFNQISMTSAEALRDSVSGTDAVLVENILRATEGSSNLIQRAKSLSAILSGDGIPLAPVELEESIMRALSLVKKIYPGKAIVLAAPPASKSRVLADSLLDEVFTNLISNSVKYTDAREVPLEIEVDEVSGQSAQNDNKSTQYIRVAVIDQGRGIPDSMKQRVFKRYQDTRSGSGLGLSIVNALVVDRYHGRVVVADRVKDNHSRGTRIEIWLQKR